jgi:hypothetical protein
LGAPHIDKLRIAQRRLASRIPGQKEAGVIAAGCPLRGDPMTDGHESGAVDDCLSLRPETNLLAAFADGRMEIPGSIGCRETRCRSAQNALRPDLEIDGINCTAGKDDPVAHERAGSPLADEHVQVGTVIDDDHRCSCERRDGFSHVSKYSPAFTMMR